MVRDEPTKVDLKFAVDATLGTLARWLRILGYDTQLERGVADRVFLRKAQQEERIVLTRKRGMAKRQFRGRLLVIEPERTCRQLSQVIEQVGLHVDLDRMHSRCALCNAVLSDVHRSEVEGLVPDYVFNQCGPFRRCSCCGRVYWPGAHRAMAIDFLKQHTPFRLP